MRTAGLLLLAAACGASDERENPWETAPPTTTATSPTTTPTSDDPEASSDDEAGSDESGDDSSASSETPDDPPPPEDYADIAKITMTPGFTDHGDGTWSMTETALDEIGFAFYAQYADDYDFLVVYTEGDFVEYGAFAYSVKYDTSGIGLDLGGYPPPFTPQDVGSAGRLMQISFMNTPMLYQGEDASIVVHETAHHWSAYIELAGTPTVAFLLDSMYGGHFNIHTNTGGPSATGYGDLVDLGGGQFQFTVQYPLKLSPLEMYLAGMIPPSEVPPLFYVTNPSGYDPATPPYDTAWSQGSYSSDATFSGTRVDFTIDDVIATNGPRSPAFGQQQTDYRFAFVLVCKDANACDPAALAGTEAQRVSFEADWDIATGGRSTADASL